MDSIANGGYRVIKKITDVIDKAEEYLLIAILSETIIVCILQVAARFLWKGSLPWSEELLRMSFIWVTFVGASLGMSRGSHICVDYFVGLLPKIPRFSLAIAARLVTLAFSIVCFRLACQFTMTSWSAGQRSTAMEIPMAIPYLGLCIGFGCMILQVLRTLFEIILAGVDGKQAAESEINF